MRRDGSGPTKLALIIVGVVFILLVIGLYSLITQNRSPRDIPQNDTPSGVTVITGGSSVRMTVYGPIVANENRESYTISVSPTSRSIETKRGYDGAVVESHTYDNNYEAYTQFVYALSRVGFDQRRDVSDAAADDRGACATGRKYVYELLENGNVQSTAWAVSCGRNQGTYVGTNSATYLLFDKQVPDIRPILRPLKNL